MPKYVDGFVLVIPKKNVAAYRKMAIMGGKSWMKYGALEYFECMGDDLDPNAGNPKEMQTLTFPQMAKLKKGETVWFSFITFKSRKHRDQVNKKVMAEMEKQYAKSKDMAMPFDVKRMAYGGFKAIVQHGK